MFYTFTQNNSGGSFVFEENKISHYVIVEAPSAKVASAIAEDIGLYFDGCDTGRDCNCCGDRWSRSYEDGSEKPEVYGESVEDPQKKQDGFEWAEFKGKPTCYVHYLDGTVKGFHV